MEAITKIATVNVERSREGAGEVGTSLVELADFLVHDRLEAHDLLF